MTDAPMTDALVLFAPDDDAHGAGTPPTFMDLRPADPPRRPHPSVRVFTDTMESPHPTYAHQIRLRRGGRVYIEPCAAVPEFPGVYLVGLRDAGYVLARLVPLVGGGFRVSYDNPVYAAREFTVWPQHAAKVRVLARVMHEAAG